MCAAWLFEGWPNSARKSNLLLLLPARSPSNALLPFFGGGFQPDDSRCPFALLSLQACQIHQTNGVDRKNIRGNGETLEGKHFGRIKTL